MNLSLFQPEELIKRSPQVFEVARQCSDLEALRVRLTRLFTTMEFEAARESADQSITAIARIRDCGQVLRNMLKERSDELAGFSMAQALHDLALGRSRPDLSPAFFADLLHILKGIQGRGSSKALEDLYVTPFGTLRGREAAVERSGQLDHLRTEVDRRMALYSSGLSKEAIERRRLRRERICRLMGASEEQWQDWCWQVNNIIDDLSRLEDLVHLDHGQRVGLQEAMNHSLPFSITPYYLSLLDDEPGGRDAALRAQVLPPLDYVRHVAVMDTSALDFMGEEDTSPFDLITRRYPAICILKPFNTCPQICVYCQRNWEIDDAMASGAFAGMEQINAAINWIREHPGIHEVLVTGGDPLAMGDGVIDNILGKLAEIPSVDRIRIGTRTLVTMPMRMTEQLADIIGKYRVPGRREIAVVTHVQHVYEITPEVVQAVDLLRKRGVPVYNQMVYTFYASRRFEACALRRLVRLVGIDPYYTFNTKGKAETRNYRVPIARLLQEQQEEARLLPGLERTDEAVFNVPRLGKNYLKSREHRDLVAIMPDGARMYEFYSWEKNISTSIRTYATPDVPILDYLTRLEAAGESVSDYDTIWYFF
ncbi:MAG: KamA family radical SAM protein [Proteobacteria bacterium]|nr:KamA family radical SAM protein [Pseudomonadota bacterium]MBU1685882.1 KamA family radical SAM protein [Pseudomonadota bacterium]